MGPRRKSDLQLRVRNVASTFNLPLKTVRSRNLSLIPEARSNVSMTVSNQRARLALKVAGTANMHLFQTLHPNGPRLRRRLSRRMIRGQKRLGRLRMVKEERVPRLRIR